MGLTLKEVLDFLEDIEHFFGEDLFEVLGEGAGFEDFKEEGLGMEHL